MTNREVEIRRLLLHMEMINIRARHEVEHRDGWTCNWAELLVQLDSELRGLLAEEQHPQHTWQQERAAVVAWLRDDEPESESVLVSHGIERGEHWPEDTKCRHCLNTLHGHEKEYCDACSQLEGGTP